jgi:hypothetical protein
MDLTITENTVGCTCGRMIQEMDSMFCYGCGDVMCYDCATDCIHCLKLYCTHCAENEAECLKCHLDTPQTVEKAYLILNGKDKHPIQDSQMIIEITSRPDARGMLLKLNGLTYEYSYRALYQREDDKSKHDYFLHFEEVIEDIKEDRIDWSKIQIDDLDPWSYPF